MHTGIDRPRPILQSKEGQYKSQGSIVMPIEHKLLLVGFWMLYKGVSFIPYKLRLLGEVGQRELEMVAGETL